MTFLLFSDKQPSRRFFDIYYRHTHFAEPAVSPSLVAGVLRSRQFCGQQPPRLPEVHAPWFVRVAREFRRLCVGVQNRKKGHSWPLPEATPCCTPGWPEDWFNSASRPKGRVLRGWQVGGNAGGGRMGTLEGSRRPVETDCVCPSIPGMPLRPRNSRGVSSSLSVMIFVNQSSRVFSAPRGHCPVPVPLCFQPASAQMCSPMSPARPCSEKVM